MENLTSTRPYLVRAIYQWMLDNNLTPYILVNTSVETTDVPTQYVKEDRIVLNISPTAVRELQLENEFVSFSARFEGIARQVYIPIQALVAIYTKENGKGLFFEQDGDIQPPPADPTPPLGPPKKSAKRPTLKVVK